MYLTTSCADSSNRWFTQCQPLNSGGGATDWRISPYFDHWLPCARSWEQAPPWVACSCRLPSTEMLTTARLSDQYGRYRITTSRSKLLLRLSFSTLWHSSWQSSHLVTPTPLLYTGFPACCPPLTLRICNFYLRISWQNRMLLLVTSVSACLLNNSKLPILVWRYTYATFNVSILRSWAVPDSHRILPDSAGWCRTVFRGA